MADIQTLVIEFYVLLPGKSIVNATHTLISLDHMTMGAISPMLLKPLLRPLGLQITGKPFSGCIGSYFQTRDKLSCRRDNGSPDIHGHCPSCSGTHRPSLPSTSLRLHAETAFHTLPQHLEPYKIYDPPIPEDQAQVSACLWVRAHPYK